MHLKDLIGRRISINQFFLDGSKCVNYRSEGQLEAVELHMVAVSVNKTYIDGEPSKELKPPHLAWLNTMASTFAGIVVDQS